MSDRPSPARSAELLLHPVVLVALTIWFCNDHVAKAAWPGVITGKLSDVAGMIVAPLLPVAALDLFRRRRGRTGTESRAIAWSLVATAVLFTAIKLLVPAAWAYQHGLALAQYPLLAGWQLATTGELPGLRPVRLVMDASDLLTLPALLVPWLLARGQEPAPSPKTASPFHVNPYDAGRDTALDPDPGLAVPAGGVPT